MNCGMRGPSSGLPPLTMSSKIFFSLGFLGSMGVEGEGVGKRVAQPTYRGLSKKVWRPTLCISGRIEETARSY